VANLERVEARGLVAAGEDDGARARVGGPSIKAIARKETPLRRAIELYMSVLGVEGSRIQIARCGLLRGGSGHRDAISSLRYENALARRLTIPISWSGVIQGPWFVPGDPFPPELEELLFDEPRA